MILHNNNLSITFIITSVIFGGIALLLACVGIGTPNWQSTQVIIDGQRHTISTANFFYACSSYTNGTLISCKHRSSDRNINQYYPIDARWNETEWNQHLDGAAGLCIVGIVFIFLGTITTLLMIIEGLAIWIYLIGPIGLFLACLFMLAGMAEGAYVLYYNDYAANLYQTAHLFTIFSFLVSCISAGRRYSFPDLREMNIPLRKQ
ncbi:unnamed protein product [Rotaria sp. Silwood2]|nr:unnamed protein product [Rotaria sp. Silwood2]CAF2713039.1 unnamed protein product [Rotaria sp. Silwood2]CAF2972423.1 unnamed protein product [Rotaria sp. Silwood2]CAF3124809.1 unnamed protein product [Rotaria sp. Silwood2]CAF4081467.1 unnamed protein product [Rotaria sp. Silwood2]